MRVADVSIDPRIGGSDAIYSYLASAEYEIGSAVFVPLGNRSVMGFVTGLREATEDDLGFSFDKLKPISGRVEGLSIPSQLVAIAKFIAAEYLCPLPAALSASLPPGVRDRLVTAWSLIEDQPDHPLTPLQAEVIRTIRDVGGTLVEPRTKPMAASSQRALRLLRTKGMIVQSQRLAPYQERKKTLDRLRLAPDAEKIEEFLHGEGKRKPAQAVTLMKLQSAPGASFAVSEIRAMAQVTEATIKALVTAGLLLPSTEWSRASAKPPKPNAYQQIAIDAVCEAVEHGEARNFLLFGITGSGKTEVYLRAAAETLRRGRHVLYLVPEIALATQSIALLRERFGDSVSILHSDLAANERLQTWLNIRAGETGVVLGARSALFAPLDNIGLIVLDEEHEGSYKQEAVPRYHARTVAIELGRQHGCPVVLGSATPSIETLYHAENPDGRLTMLSLPERTARAKLPRVEIEDLTLGYRQGNPSMLGALLQERIHSALSRKEQVILFLNRRAYSPFLICRDCGFQYECPNCAVSLSFHRKEGRLRCHHCGFQRRPDDVCPSCGGHRVLPLGIGTERVEEAVSSLFEGATVARLDRDVARRKGALEQVLASFRSGDTDILVGTQMVAKGLDFPNVTLVGVIAADISLNIPDFRSSERTCQLLSQVSGRAGRGDSPGTVVIQTFNPDHPAVVAAAAHDYASFYDELRLEREEAQYPPFVKLVNVMLSGENRPAVVKASADIAERLANEGLRVLGPVDCAVERLQGRWRRHVLIKLEPGASGASIIAAIGGFAVPGVQVMIDVDPYSML